MKICYRIIAVIATICLICLIFSFFPRSISSVMGLSSLDIDSCSVVVNKTTSASVDFTGNSLYSILEVLKDTDVVYNSSDLVIDSSLNNTEYLLFFNYNNEAHAASIHSSGYFDYHGRRYEILFSKGNDVDIVNFLQQNIPATHGDGSSEDKGTVLSFS